MASIINLKEDAFYEKLPEGILDIDARGLIQALMGGIQDRFEDNRSFAKNLQNLLVPGALPETGDNVILVDLVSPKGKAYTRSLDIQDGTPATEGTKLTAWAADQLGLETSQVSNVRYGVDLLRYVDANILDYLASTIGAIIYSSTGLTSSEQAQAPTQLVQTWFPRLKIKGTAKSFEVLGKILGFEDLKFTSLFQRLSPRDPSDIGNQINDTDFNAIPDFYPRQTFSAFYNPLEQDDGPFYTWSGTVAQGTSATDFYTQVINDFNPWIDVLVLGVENGTVIAPQAGSYVLGSQGTQSEGAPSKKAYVDPADSTVRFQAISEGDSFNGLAVVVADTADATKKVITITDQLSTVKYQSSYFDLAMTMTFDRAEEVFGDQAMRPNDDLEDTPALTSDGTAVSPYRPWHAGTFASAGLTQDWLFSGTVAGVIVARTQASGTDRQQRYDDLAEAGAQVLQALNEVRPATRFPRRSSFGYLNRDNVQYAPYLGEYCLFSTGVGSVTVDFSGSLLGHPLSPYDTTFVYDTATDSEAFCSESNGSLAYHHHTTGTGTITGTSTGDSYFMSVSGTFPTAGTICAVYTVTSSEVIRPEPYCTVPGTYVFGAIGDYGEAGANQTAVVNMVRSWGPDSIVLLGDNNYPDGQESTIEATNAVLADFNAAGRLFPTIGNHDYSVDLGGTLATPYLDYYNIPDSDSGNKRYYRVRRGPVEWFILNSGLNNTASSPAAGDPDYSDCQEPDGNSVDSIQARWLQAALESSTARWKLVSIHHPPFASATTTNNYYPGYPRLAWPLKQWGAHAAFHGHIHAYERLDIDGFPHFISGNGGQTNRLFDSGTIYPGSQVRYDTTFTDYGALRITATDTFLHVESFIVTYGTTVDAFLLTAGSQSCRYQARAEDELDTDQIYTFFDEYPWRRDIVGGGEIIDLDAYDGTIQAHLTPVGDTMAVLSQDGAEYTVYGFQTTGTTLRLAAEARDTDPDDYVGGQAPVAFSGVFRDLATLPADYKEDYVNPHDPLNFRTLFSRTDMDAVFQPGWQLYTAGLVQGVLVADPNKFFRSAHREGLEVWLPLNEDAEDHLEVRNAASTVAVQTLAGISSTDRQYDADTYGGYLALRPNSSVTSVDASVNVEGSYSLGLWMQPRARLDDFGTTTFLQWGPVSMDISHHNETVIVYVEGTNYERQAVGSLGISPAGIGFTYVHVEVNPSTITYGLANLFGGISFLTNTSFTPRAFDEDTDDRLVLRTTDRELWFRDVRAWNLCKTEDDITAVRRHDPTATATLYRPGWFNVANTTDRYGLTPLPTGWLKATRLPPWLRTPKLARIQRYDSLGLYEGESRFKEVGLGGGRSMPELYNLGEQFYNLTAAGETVYSTWHGALPGVNEAWLVLTDPGTYAILTASYTGSGTYFDQRLTGTSSPWPNAMIETNPLREAIWVEGTDGALYEITLKSAGSNSATFVTEKICRNRTDAELELNRILQVVESTGSIYVVTAQGTIYDGQLLIQAGTSYTIDSQNNATGELVITTAGTTEVKVYHPQNFICQYQPTGAEVTLEESGTHLTVSFGSVIQEQFSGTDTTPPLYMYLNSRIVEEVASAYDRWTERVDPSNFGNEQDPPVAALNENGLMEFDNASTLTPGNYRLTIESGNIGRTDQDFDGFIVEIRVDSAVFNRRLLRGLSGYNIRGVDTFEFEIETGVAGAWILSLEWTNHFADADQDVARQLAVYSYKLERIQTEAYRIDIAASGDAPEVTQLTTSVFTGTTPGGWLVGLSSWGTVSEYRHESVSYSTNDTLSNVSPISNLLTGATHNKREDIIYVTSDAGTGDTEIFFSLSDVGSYTFGGAGSIFAFVTPPSLADECAVSYGAGVAAETWTCYVLQSPASGTLDAHLLWDGRWVYRDNYTGVVAEDDFDGYTVQSPISGTLALGGGFDEEWKFRDNTFGPLAGDDWDGYATAGDAGTVTLDAGFGFAGSWELNNTV